MERKVVNMQPIKSYNDIQAAFDYFNKQLFKNELSACLITYQRQKKSLAYFSPKRFANNTAETERVHEIAFNPSTFKGRSDREILSTLVHEMTHLWQEEHGTPPRRNYHNKQWSARMESMGLMPSDTAAEGGKKTGQRVSHYIIEGGKFEKITTPFVSKNQTLLFQDVSEPAKSKNKNKVKYTCPSCEVNVWGKADLNIRCDDCDEQFALSS